MLFGSHKKKQTDVGNARYAELLRLEVSTPELPGNGQI